MFTIDTEIEFYEKRLDESIASWYNTPWCRIFKRTDLNEDIKRYATKVDTLKCYKRLVKNG
jgi:hypothetical protein